jgi:very-short-patch-repair endonuclease
MHYNSAEANSREQREQRKALRNNSTTAEGLMWRVLKGRQCGGLKFRRQQGIGPYILDFYCPELRLCVELDGSSHDYKFEYDEERTAFLERQGIKVLRYRNEDVYCNPLSIADDILRQIQKDTEEDTDPTPTPSP